MPEADLALAVRSTLAVMHCLATPELVLLERTVKRSSHTATLIKPLLSVSGIGDILALTIMRETGDIGRFATVGHSASYCRCVGSQKLSNGKRKDKATPRMATNTWPGRLWRPPILPCATTARSNAITNARRTKPMGWWRSRRWRINWHGPASYVMRDQVPFETAKAFG